jgi:hypothetical protein
MSASPASLEQEEIGAVRLEHGLTNVYELNDNGGKDFTFAPARDGQGWISQDLEDAGARIQLPASEAARARRVALSAIKSTDVLVIGLDDRFLPLGITLRPDTAARRGAWYSVGFLLRGAAARLLEVETSEIEVGLRTIRSPDGAVGAQVFLSDALANGAGYCSHLGEPQRFHKLLDEAARWLKELELHTNSGEPCSSACYKCLKDYRNMAYHALLDWRMAADLLGLMRGEGLDTHDRWTSLGHDVVSDFARQFEGFESATVAGIPVAVSDPRCLIAVHPLAETDVPRVSESLAEVVLEVNSKGFNDQGHTRFLFADYFDLLRRPGHVYSRLWA